jgi:hypothetical protein
MGKIRRWSLIFLSVFNLELFIPNKTSPVNCKLPLHLLVTWRNQHSNYRCGANHEENREPFFNIYFPDVACVYRHSFGKNSTADRSRVFFLRGRQKDRDYPEKK